MDLNLVVPYKFKSEKDKELQGKGFHTVTVWGPMADVAGQYIRPGSQVFISGRLQTDSWEDNKSGEKRTKTKIVALDLIMLDPKDGQTPVPDGASQTLNLVNRADIVGNVTRDPELRTTTGGQKVLTLGIATNDRWKDKASGDLKERSEFHNVVVWGDLAEEVSSVLKKGQRVFASGRVQTRSWETQQGSKRTTTEIVAETVSLLGMKSAAAEESVQTDASRVSNEDDSTGAPASGEKEASEDIPEVQYASEVKAEDLPF